MRASLIGPILGTTGLPLAFASGNIWVVAFCGIACGFNWGVFHCGRRAEAHS
jgi:hypothetical protein